MRSKDVTIGRLTCRFGWSGKGLFHDVNNDTHTSYLIDVSIIGNDEVKALRIIIFKFAMWLGCPRLTQHARPR